MKRKKPEEAENILKGSKTVAVIEAVCDTTNIGSIFRSAAALGIDAVLLTPDSCDPLNRRCVRVSMGSVFRIPWAFVPDPVMLLKEQGFTTVALALKDNSLPISDPILNGCTRIALVLGSEGWGLPESTIAKCDYTAIIPMQRGVDSLNVGTAAAIAFYQFTHTSR